MRTIIAASRDRTVIVMPPSMPRRFPPTTRDCTGRRRGEKASRGTARGLVPPVRSAPGPACRILGRVSPPGRGIRRDRRDRAMLGATLGIAEYLERVCQEVRRLDPAQVEGLSAVIEAAYRAGR